jgi:glycosyltransferase involved in cell wall biosynthesis
VFVLPSRWEGSSVALLEAMAVGVPVIASRLAGDAAQVLDEGRYGLLVGGDDRTELARAILVQLSGYAVRPGDRACAYGLPGAAYLDLIEAVMAEMDGTARVAA